MKIENLMAKSEVADRRTVLSSWILRPYYRTRQYFINRKLDRILTEFEKGAK